MIHLVLALGLSIGQAGPGSNSGPPAATIGRAVLGAPQEAAQAQPSTTPGQLPVAPANGDGKPEEKPNGKDNGKDMKPGPTPTPAAPDDKANGNGNGEKTVYGPIMTLFRAYPASTAWFPNIFGKPDPEAPDPPPAPRRGLPAPLMSPPFPSAEWQGTPIPGQPLSTGNYPLTDAIWAIQAFGIGDWFKDNRIKMYGWVNGSTNWTTNKNSNAPDSYWVSANRIELDQFVFKIEREVDSVQQDHIDYGFRSVALYGQDYRYTTAGGWGGNQLFEHNLLYGWDPIEQYFDVYIPWVSQGLIIRVGRWVACPDIETQLAPDNYLGTHSILFTFDTYTQTGIQLNVRLNDNWIVQANINAGNDMAPWYKGATPCGFFGVRWDLPTEKDSIYTCLNQIDSAQFRHFLLDGQPAGHDNFNYVVSTWQHAFSQKFVTKLEGYFMWQYNAELGGTPSIGPVQPYGGGGGDGKLLPGRSLTYGTVNYWEYALSKTDFTSFRWEWWHDERGMRSGFPGLYMSATVGMTHFFSQNLEVRPECGYYRNLDNPAFDNGTAKGAWIAGCDMILRF